MKRVAFFSVIMFMFFGSVFGVPVESTNAESEIQVQNQVKLSAEAKLFEAFKKEFDGGNYDEAMVFSNLLNREFPESKYAEKARNMMIDHIKTKKPQKRNIEPFILNTSFNLLYGALGFAAIPYAVSPGNVSNHLAIGLSLAGLTTGLISSYVLYNRGLMDYGRSLAIEFHSLMAIMNTTAINQALFTPKSTAKFVTYVPSAFETVFTNYNQFTQFDAGIIGIMLLSTRAVSTILTDGKEYSPGKYTLMMNSMFWGYLLSTFIITEAKIDPENPKNDPNKATHFPYESLISATVANASVFLVSVTYDRLNWTDARSWVVSLSGLGGMLFTYSLYSLIDWQFTMYHYGIINFFGGIIGLATGALFTQNMPVETSLAKEKNTGFAIMPNVAKDDFGLTAWVYHRF
jgi:hypothetical protein